MLTTTPNAVAGKVHDRMPVILDPDSYDLWLDPGMRDVTAASELLKPYNYALRQGCGSRRNCYCGTLKMLKKFKSKLNGDPSRDNATASFTLPFDTREVWGKAKVPVKVTINGYTWRSTVGNRGWIQYIVVNAEARFHAGVKAGDVVAIILEPDTETRDVEIPIQLRRALGAKLTEKLNRLSFSHKKELVVWYSEAKREDTRARRVEKMKAMLLSGKVIS